MTLRENFKNVFSYAAGVQNWVNKSTGVEGGYNFSFAHDFAIADWMGGRKEIRETWQSILSGWQDNYKVLAEAISQILMMKCAHWRMQQDGIENRDYYIQAYEDLYYIADRKYNELFKDNEEALDYLFFLTD